MVSFHSAVAVATTVLSVLGLVQGVPLADKLKRLSPSARDILKRSGPAAPRFVAYNDKWLRSFPPASDLKGFNVFILTFLLTSGAVDQARVWEQLNANQRTKYVDEYNQAGISLMVSTFGSAENPTSSDPVAVANSMASWVARNNVNGIDVDYEDFAAFNSGRGVGENWIINFTRQLRRKLPQGEYTLTHSPVAPWFSPGVWGGGGYMAVHKSVGSLVDWYNVQFYNQGEYTTCSGLLTASTSGRPQTALFQIAEHGIPLNKLVIGKPANPSDAKEGYMDPSSLASCVSEAASKNWNGGVAVWEYPDATSSWISTVRGNTWPVW